jgi:hypothetical protein
MSKELIEQLAIPQDIVDDLKTVGLYLTETDHVLSAIVELIILRDQRKAYAQTQGQSKWIDSNVTPCPDDGKSYWLFDRETGFMAIQSDWSVNTDEFNLQWIDGKEPSHWMPLTLPAAPIESGVKG